MKLGKVDKTLLLRTCLLGRPLFLCLGSSVFCCVPSFFRDVFALGSIVYFVVAHLLDFWVIGVVVALLLSIMAGNGGSFFRSSCSSWLTW